MYTSILVGHAIPAEVYPLTPDTLHRAHLRVVTSYIIVNIVRGVSIIITTTIIELHVITALLENIKVAKHPPCRPDIQNHSDPYVTDIS